ncbi:MAG: hypothetical protein AAFQ91_33940 [Cyanobacteria bacterium J06621_15]
MSKPVGVGAVNGESFSRKFAAQGYQVAMLARNIDYLEKLSQEIPDSKAYQYDVTEIYKTAEATIWRKMVEVKS